VSSVVLSVEQTAAIAELAREHGEALVKWDIGADRVFAMFEDDQQFVVSDEGEVARG
jgi:hypothetical protein